MIELKSVSVIDGLPFFCGTTPLKGSVPMSGAVSFAARLAVLSLLVKSTVPASPLSVVPTAFGTVTVNVRDAPAPVEERKPLICKAGRASAPDSSKTVPPFEAPPRSVVPYRLPLLSMIRASSGTAPSVPLNETSVVIVPLPWASSNTVPSSEAASQCRCAVEIAAAVHDQAGIRLSPSVPLNEASVVIVAAVGQLENRAVSVGRLRASLCRTGCRCCP